MSGEATTLRLAAKEMRVEAGLLDDDLHLMWHGVADWLDEVAWRSENRPKQYRAARHALTVARAYLGESS